MKLKALAFVVGLALIPFAPSLAHATASVGLCQMLFAGARVQALPEAKRETYAKFLELNAQGALTQIGSPREIAKVLTDTDLPVFGERLEKIINEMYNSDARVTVQAFYDHVFELLEAEKIPDVLIRKGIEENKKGQRGSLRRLLGDLSFAETRAMYMGHTGPGTEFTADSLLGQYVRETGATVKLMQVKDLVNNVKFPEAKLFVAVSADSFPSFIDHFSQRTMMSSFGHGSILTAGYGYDVSGGKNALRPMNEFTPLPLLILKPSEGERLYRYVELGATPKYRLWNHGLKQPWLLKNSVTGVPYVEPGAYTCCTNFNGNLPIGDKLVNEYTLPLKVTNNPVAPPGGGPVPPPPPREPVIGSKLHAWDDPNNIELKDVWTVPGHEQMSSVIGQAEKNVNGEFASPGYVIQTLMGEASSERVPVIFIFLKDHKGEIPDDPALHFERPF